MRKLAGFKLLIIMMAMVLVIAACSDGSNSPSSNNNTPAQQSNSGGNGGGGGDATTPETDPWQEVEGEVTMWAFNEDVFEEIAEAFMQEYPKIKVNAIFVPFWDLHDQLQTTLNAGSGAPDIAEVEVNQFTRYVTGGVLEDLLAEPYNVGQYREFIADYNWERWRSPDGTQLLGMPWDSTPGVYYYRHDIFEELGLPSDPKELGEYIKDPENFIQLAQVMTANGKYLFEWGDGPVHWAGDEIGYFDDDLNWVRDTQRLIDILDVTRRGHQLNWSPFIGWNVDEGKQMMLSGELVGTVLGSWGSRELANTFPEMAGQWRVTNLPLGINTAIGGSSFVMPSQSQNKEAAWVYMQWMMRSENAWKIWTKYSIQPGYSDIATLDWYADQGNDFLGGQKEYQLYEELAQLIPAKRLNPLDGRGWELWVPRILDAINNNIDSRATMELVKEDVANTLQDEIEALKQQLGQN